ncbi:membrane-associated protein, putative [Bodo saltans]|uniref:Membrane-associated protein, putative n=1 Tax=Bodo saltans TaxID=75058 RepID=A0A0S4JBY2_BODSA|nr:membrane-associated protein, putative [Bodo saltans]|eukprot:CUG88910.1 membrane-associated protein, putative [Bodo saltans]
MTSQRGSASPRWVTALALSAVIGYILLCSSYGGSSTTTADTGTDRVRAPSPNSGVVASFSPALGTTSSRRHAASVETLSSDDPSDPQQRTVEEDERNVQSSSSSSRRRQPPTTPRPSYHAWFVSIFSSHFGRAIADALYDAEIFNTMTHSLSEENERGLPEWPLDDGDFEFSSISLKLPPTAPQHFSNISNVLWWAKRWLSVAVSKISRDGELEKLYEHVVSSGGGGGGSSPNLKLNLLEKTTVRALNAQVQYFHTILQLAIDTCLTWRQKIVLREMGKRHRGTADPLVLLSGWITAATTVDDLAALFSSASNLPLQSTSSTLAEVLEKRAAELATTPNLVGPEDARSLFPLNYDDVPYSQSRPLNGKFWNMLRPTAGCSSIVRLCEIPDGCRLLCNGEYLLHAGRKRQSDNVKAVVTGVQSSHHAAGDGAALPTIVAEAQPKQQLQGVQSNKQYHHRIIGMGCNNQFDWELSLLSLFQNTEALSTGHHQHHHRIGWMTSMDCTITLAPGRRQWKVPGILKRSAVGYTGASVCAGSSSFFPKVSSSSINATTLIGPRDLKAFQLKNEATWGLPTQADQPLVRFTAHPDAIAASQRRIRQTTETHQGNISETENNEFPMLSTAAGGSSSSRSPLWFDALTILKIDIEGFEWKYIPAWIRGEFKSLSLNAPPQAVAQGSTDAIDFATAVPEFFTVSLFSLEFHRIGFRNITGASSYGALRTHWLSLQVHALGFLMIAHEKNEYSQCCFEYSYVHVRHFIKSEMWMALRDEL